MLLSSNDEEVKTCQASNHHSTQARLITAGINAMEIYEETREVPFSPEQMFDLVSDVESYGEFLPGWYGATIIEQDGDVVFVDQEVGMRGFHTSFITQAIFSRPERIEISSSDGPFLYFAVRWTFERVEESACLTHFYAGFELRSRFLERVAGPFFSDVMRRGVQAFERRARQLYDLPDTT
jgi:coenzyme Q-binding protein COQ10